MVRIFSKIKQNKILVIICSTCLLIALILVIVLSSTSILSNGSLYYEYDNIVYGVEKVEMRKFEKEYYKKETRSDGSQRM